MKSIGKIVKENKEEAYELLKKAGGHIDFAEGLDEDGAFDDCGDCPPVIFGMEELIDGIALAVRIGEEPNSIEFWGYDCGLLDNVDWMDTDDCLQYTENEIYLAIEGWCKEHKII